MATVYLATTGRRGVQEIAHQNLQKAHYAAAEIAKIPGFSLQFSAPFFNEFVVKTPKPASEIVNQLIDKKMLGGIALDAFYPQMNNSLLVCVTETTTRKAIDNLVAALASSELKVFESQ